jgi:hypothetical protein
MMAPAPPAWADAWLRLLLPARDRDTVSGDLMEEYRERIRPQRSALSANAWYLGQVLRLAWHVSAWSLVLAATHVSRTAYDWFVPTTNFESRAAVTTYLMISTLLVIGASTTLRTRSAGSGTIATLSALIVSAIVSAIALGAIYLSWRSPALMAAIEQSGGLAEVFAIPFLIIVPGTVVGAVGAVIAALRTKATLEPTS